jgi:hypothetical protein
LGSLGETIVQTNITPWSGSTRKIVKLGEIIKNTSFTPPRPMKDTPVTSASNSNDVSTGSVSKAGDVMMMSSSLRKIVSYLRKNHLRAQPLP